MSLSRISGRPRSEKSRAAILQAAFRILVECGYGGFTIEAVASEAGAGKTTVYRWWKTKAELAVDAFLHATTDELALSETASARADFRAQITALGALLRDGRGQALAAMLGGARSDPALARALGERWLEPRRRWGFERISKAAASGELRDGIKPVAALAVLYGPMYTPLLFGGDVPGAEAVQDYLDVACEGVFAKATR
jgi:AcrR family transcriptional regulator